MTSLGSPAEDARGSRFDRRRPSPARQRQRLGVPFVDDPFAVDRGATGAAALRAAGRLEDGCCRKRAIMSFLADSAGAQKTPSAPWTTVACRRPAGPQFVAKLGGGSSVTSIGRGVC